jgi:hypothetical protein
MWLRTWVPILGGSIFPVGLLIGAAGRSLSGQPWTVGQTLAAILVMALALAVFLQLSRVMRDVEAFADSPGSLQVRYRGFRFERVYAIPWARVALEHWTTNDPASIGTRQQASSSQFYLRFPNPLPGWLDTKKSTTIRVGEEVVATLGVHVPPVERSRP